jgi:hypothetical protein
MAVSPRGDPPKRLQAIDATCLAGLPDITTAPDQDTTDTIRWRRFAGRAFKRARSAKRIATKVSFPLQGLKANVIVGLF